MLKPIFKVNINSRFPVNKILLKAISISLSFIVHGYNFLTVFLNTDKVIERGLPVPGNISSVEKDVKI